MIIWITVKINSRQCWIPPPPLPPPTSPISCRPPPPPPPPPHSHTPAPIYNVYFVSTFNAKDATKKRTHCSTLHDSLSCTFPGKDVVNQCLVFVTACFVRDDLGQGRTGDLPVDTTLYWSCFQCLAPRSWFILAKVVRAVCGVASCGSEKLREAPWETARGVLTKVSYCCFTASIVVSFGLR